MTVAAEGSPHLVARQFILFLAVGVANTAVCFVSIFIAMKIIGLPPFVANAAGYVLAVSNSYVLNRLITFRDATPRRGDALRFVAVFFAAYGLNAAALGALLSYDPTRPMVWQVVGMAVYTVSFFFLSRRFVFAK